jgi:hypothetical protein
MKIKQDGDDPDETVRQLQQCLDVMPAFKPFNSYHHLMIFNRKISVFPGGLE